MVLVLVLVPKSLAGRHEVRRKGEKVESNCSPRLVFLDTLKIRIESFDCRPEGRSSQVAFMVRPGAAGTKARQIPLSLKDACLWGLVMASQVASKFCPADLKQPRKD